jgi:hypothetical protein
MTPTTQELQQLLGVEQHEAEFYRQHLQHLDDVLNALETISRRRDGTDTKDPDQ